MEWAQWALDLAGVLAWPLTVALLVWWLREPIRERFGHVERVSALGVEVEIAQRRQVEREAKELEEALTTTASDEVAATDEVTAELKPGPAETGQADPSPPHLSDAQRRAIGELVQQAAEWGRVRTEAGQSVDGAYLDWTDGVPSLVTPPMQRGKSMAARLNDAIVRGAQGSAGLVRRLEERVDELDKERRRAQYGFVTHPTERTLSDQRYKEAVERLRAVDPDSPYLP